MKDLIVVDMQKGFINEKNEFLVEKINSLLKNNRFNCVYYTRFRNHSECPFKTLLNYDGMMEKDAQEIIVSRKNNSCVLHKSSYGLESNDIELLKAKDVKEIYLCGTDVDACILAIAFQLFDSGIKPILVWDAVGSSSKTDFKESLKPLFQRNFGNDSIIEHI